MSQLRYCLGMLRRYIHPKFFLSLQRIQKLKDRHRGQRCFIIGNGPSLNRMDLSLLRDEFTIGMNRIYLLFDRLGFSTSYYVSVNPLVVEQCAEEIISRVPCPKFLDWNTRHLIRFAPDMIFLKAFHEEPRFFTDISRGIWQGNTVTYVAMQIAYTLGFSQVILIGVDHRFATTGTPHKQVVSQGDDPNHFDGGYFGKDFRWQLPDLAGSELAYRIARYQYDLAGREIVDATVDGALQVFPKVDYASLFARKAAAI